MGMDMELTILWLDIYKDMIQMLRSSKSLFFFNQTLDCWNHSDTCILRSVLVITDSILLINTDFKTLVKISTI